MGLVHLGWSSLQGSSVQGNSLQGSSLQGSSLQAVNIQGKKLQWALSTHTVTHTAHMVTHTVTVHVYTQTRGSICHFHGADTGIHKAVHTSTTHIPSGLPMKPTVSLHTWPSRWLSVGQGCVSLGTVISWVLVTGVWGFGGEL